MKKRICPICDHPMQHEHYCAFCRQWIKNPHYVNATYYLNERHPANEINCEYHNMGENTLEKDVKSGTDTVNALVERAKAFLETHSATTAGRQPQHYKSGQSVERRNNTYQPSQRKKENSMNGKQKKNSGKSIVKIIVIIFVILYAVNFLYNIILALLWLV